MPSVIATQRLHSHLFASIVRCEVWKRQLTVMRLVTKEPVEAVSISKSPSIQLPSRKQMLLSQVVPNCTWLVSLHRLRVAGAESSLQHRRRRGCYDSNVTQRNSNCLLRRILWRKDMKRQPRLQQGWVKPPRSWIKLTCSWKGSRRLQLQCPVIYM